MTQVSPDSKAWPKAGAAPQPVASGEQIDTDQDPRATDAAAIQDALQDGEEDRPSGEAHTPGVEDRKTEGARRD